MKRFMLTNGNLVFGLGASPEEAYTDAKQFCDVGEVPFDDIPQYDNRTFPNWRILVCDQALYEAVESGIAGAPWEMRDGLACLADE